MAMLTWKGLGNRGDGAFFNPHPHPGDTHTHIFEGKTFARY